MLEDTIVIHGQRANYREDSFSSRKIRILDDFSNEWEKDFYRANLENMPDGLMLEDPMPEKTTLILKSEQNPYWLEIYTTEKTWAQKLINHPLAVVRLAHTWPTGEDEQHYILPSVLLYF